MRLWLVSLLLAATAVSLVEGCRGLNEDRTDFKEKCDEWWKKANRAIIYPNKKIIKCINLIKDKCPTMIKVENYHVDKKMTNYYTRWYITKKAIYGTGESITFKVKERRGVCADDDGRDGDCDFWWKHAMWKKAQDHIVDRCVNQVLKHCNDMITLVNKDTTTSKQFGIQPCDITTYTYRYNNQEVTFRRYRFSKDCKPKS